MSYSGFNFCFLLFFLIVRNVGRAMTSPRYTFGCVSGFGSVLLFQLFQSYGWFYVLFDFLTSLLSIKVSSDL